MTTLWYKELEDIYNKLEKINIKDIEPGSVRFIVYSEEGAQGLPNDFTMLTKDLKVSENRYLNGNITQEDIIRVIPEFKDIKIGCREFSGPGLDNWNVFNMGLGNFLFVNKEVSDKFLKELKHYITIKTTKKSIKYDLYEFYTIWLYGALAALKFDK